MALFNQSLDLGLDLKPNLETFDSYWKKRLTTCDLGYLKLDQNLITNKLIPLLKSAERQLMYRRVRMFESE
jgi:hypothetical protein